MTSIDKELTDRMLGDLCRKFPEVAFALNPAEDTRIDVRVHYPAEWTGRRVRSTRRRIDKFLPAWIGANTPWNSLGPQNTNRGAI